MKILNPAFIILLFCFLSAQHTFAQTERNLWLVNGSGNVKFVNNKEVQRSTLSSGTWKEFYIDSDFKVGNFIVDDFSLGLSFFSAYRFGETSGGNIYYNAFMVSGGPDLRYYLFTFKEKCLFFVNGNYQFGRQFIISKVQENTHAKFRRAHFLGGMEYMLNPTVGFEFNVGYKHTFLSFDQFPYKPLMVQNGLFWSLGISLHLVKKS
ncbi:MAG TPA: hypothetical protein PKD18_21240 [Saprospiraceae bacterium]|nr:hypothetical protein [Saprospiraceae bacterium]